MIWRHHLCQAGAGRGRGWEGLEDWKNFFYSPKSFVSQLKVPGRGSGLLKVTSSLEAKPGPCSQSPGTPGSFLSSALDCELGRTRAEQPHEARSVNPAPRRHWFSFWPLSSRARLTSLFIHHSELISDACPQAWGVRDTLGSGLSPACTGVLLCPVFPLELTTSNQLENSLALHPPSS